MLNSDPHQQLMFFEIHSRGFSGRAHDDNTISTLLNMKINQRAITLQIQCAVIQHWRHDGNQTTSKHDHLSSEKRIFYLKPAKRKSLPFNNHSAISRDSSNAVVTVTTTQQQINLF
jgi:hypothetical protein